MEVESNDTDRVEAITNEIHGMLQEVLASIIEGTGLRELSKGIAQGVAMIDPKLFRHLQAVKETNE